MVTDDEGATGSITKSVTVTAPAGIVGKGYTLSKNADFSTDDRAFSVTDTLYMKIWSEEINSKYMRKAQYEVKVNKKRFMGELTNNYDGSFTAALKMSQVPTGSGTVKLKLEDSNRIKYEVKDIRITVTR